MFRASLRVPRQEVRIVTPNPSAQPEPPRQPGSRRGRMQADSAAVEEVPVWLEVNGEPTVTWMCTPDQLEELATGWLHGEGYIETMDDLLRMRPDRKSTRLNSSHLVISYAVFCLKKKKQK